MNIVRENRETQTAIIKVTIDQTDYAKEVDKKLHEYKRKSNVPGFRPGMVPMGIINKMYSKGVTAEVAYKMASDNCFDYLEKEKIEYVGDVLPAEEQGAFDFENNSQHEFIFEIGIAPEVNIELTEKDKVVRYKIKPTDEMKEQYRSNFLRQYGHLEDVDVVIKDEAVTAELDNGELKIEEGYVGLISMSDEERKPFIGKKVGDQMVVNVNELYKDAKQRASMLSLDEKELANVNPEFNLKITKIRQFANPKMNEEFFKQAFPDGNVTDEKGFEAYIDSKIEAELENESGYIFTNTLRKYLLKTAGLTLPEEFLKRWLLMTNEGKISQEEIESEFAGFAEMMKWSAILKHFAKKLNIELTEEIMLNEAKAFAGAQFAQYGMMNAGDEMLENYAKQILSNKQEANKLAERAYEREIIQAITPLVKITSKSVTIEELGKILEKEK